MSVAASLPDLLSLTQLRQVANTTPQPYRIHAQVDAVTQKQTAAGKLYYDVKLTDGSEPIVWRVFDNNPLLAEAAQLARGAWLELSAQWVDTGKYGLDPRNASMRQLTSEETQRLMAGDERLRERQLQDYGEIVTRIAVIADPRLRALCELFIEKFGERFRRCAAARMNHHARRGGLVEHVAQMMRSAGAVASVYPQLNADLMIAGVLFHDCGKLWETCFQEGSFNMPYHLSGEMLGHITLGMELINKLWRDLISRSEAADWIHLEPANDLVRLHLLHLVASHHGELAFGSPVLPKTPEAMALHYVDNLDAKLEMFRRGYETGAELGQGIYEKVWPLPNLVAPLMGFVKSAAMGAALGNEAAETGRPAPLESMAE